MNALLLRLALISTLVISGSSASSAQAPQPTSADQSINDVLRELVETSAVTGGFGRSRYDVLIAIDRSIERYVTNKTLEDGTLQSWFSAHVRMTSGDIAP